MSPRSENPRPLPTEINTIDITLHHAGISDKYGNVYVEKMGNLGRFDDPREPIAVMRARDNLAMKVLRDYLGLCESTAGVVGRQVASVRRQLDAFATWRKYNPDKTRLPGARPG